MSDIVRLLERAEEGCEGLKHGYYDLPCVYFLIFLCHDIKNKIRQVGFLKKNKIKQNFPKLFLVVFKKNLEKSWESCLYLDRPKGYCNARSAWNARKALLRPLYCLLAGRDKSLYYLRPIILWNARRATGTEP